MIDASKVERVDPGKYGKHKYIRESDYLAMVAERDGLLPAPAPVDAAPKDVLGTCDTDQKWHGYCGPTWKPVETPAPKVEDTAVELPPLDAAAWFEPEWGNIITDAKNRCFGKRDVQHELADEVLQRRRQLLAALTRTRELEKRLAEARTLISRALNVLDEYGAGELHEEIAAYLSQGSKESKS